VDPTIIVLGIRALLRIAREGQAAYEQYQRDRPALFPSGQIAPATDVAFLRKVFSRHLDEIEDGGAYTRYWKGTGPDPAVPGAAEILRMRAIQLDLEDNAATGLAPVRRVEIGGAAMIQQWAAGREPVGPVGRMVTCLADVALEFVGAKPSVLGMGGGGEKLIGAVAGRLATLIPDDAEERGPRSQLAERAVGLFVRAGLEALDQQADAWLGDDAVRDLVEHTLPPLIAVMPSDLATDLVAQSRWTALTDALLGPLAGGAVRALARGPGGFAGSGIDAGALVGSVTRALLEQAAVTGLHEPLGPAGFMALHRAALALAATRPALLAEQDAAPELFRRLAASLRNLPPPFDGDLAGSLAAAALEAVGGAAPPGDGWQERVAGAVTAVADGVRPALTAAGPHTLLGMLGPSQLVGLAGVVLRQGAAAPGMLAPGRRELEAIARGLGLAIAADRQGLLAPDDWLAIAGVAAGEAAANPGRLFPLAATSPEAGVAADVITRLVAVGTDELARGRDAGGLLFGATLRQAIILALRGVAGPAAPGVDRAAAAAALAVRLGEAAAKPSGFGSRAWLALYGSLLPGALRGTPTDTLSQAALDDLLAKGSIA
jgi:hypothetical protein